MFQDWIDHYHRSNFFSGWLEWNATALQAWNTLLVPWMGSPLFTQALSGVLENYLAMYKAMGLQERNERIDLGLPPGVGQSPRTKHGSTVTTIPLTLPSNIGLHCCWSTH